MSTIPKYFNDLEKLKAEIVSKLTRGFLDKKSPCRFLVFSTSVNSIVNSRIVVLRNFCSKKWQILIHTDCRSEKLKEIEKNKNVSLNFWDYKNNFQLRIKGKAKKIIDGHNEQWNSLNSWSKRTYLSKRKPGTVSINPLSGFDEKFLKKPPSKDECHSGIKNFCQIRVFVRKIDCLILSRQGYRRALFEVKKDCLLKKWLVP